jgi:hypothetical protein
MKATELRIGNLILSRGLMCEVEKIESDGLLAQFNHTEAEMDYNRGLEGIPLTEEWLLKFGFGFDKILGVWQQSDYFFEIEARDNGWNNVVNGGEYYHGNTFYYVHQLQNLFFALTGDELTIKE